MHKHPWLGEQTVSQWQPYRTSSESLSQFVQQQAIAVIWLAPDKHLDSAWLPSLLFEPQGRQLIWRILPDFDILVEKIVPTLNSSQREFFYDRLQHKLSLSTYRIAMLGTRGVPANYSGIEKYVEEIGHYLVQQGTQVTVYCHAKYTPQRGQYRGLDLQFMPTILTKHLETIVHTALSTGHALLAGYEIFHYHALGPSALTWLPRLCGRKVVCTVQGLDWNRAKWGRTARWYLQWGEWSTVKFPHRTMVGSQTLADHYSQHNQKPAIYIPNDFEPLQPQPTHQIKNLGLDQDSYFLFVGRLSPEKGCHTLIQAFNDVKTEKQLVLAGRVSFDDHYYQDLQQIVDNSNKIHFVGFVTGSVLQELYSNAYVVVHPSELEGLSVTVLEALSYHNCLLVSNIPENLEALQNLGHSFQVGDRLDLTEKLQWLCDDLQLVQQTRRQVQAQADQFWPWQKVGQATYELYEALMEKCY